MDYCSSTGIRRLLLQGSDAVKGRGVAGKRQRSTTPPARKIHTEYSRSSPAALESGLRATIFGKSSF